MTCHQAFVDQGSCRSLVVTGLVPFFRVVPISRWFTLVSEGVSIDPFILPNGFDQSGPLFRSLFLYCRCTFFRVVTEGPHHVEFPEYLGCSFVVEIEACYYSRTIGDYVVRMRGKGHVRVKELVFVFMLC